MSTLYSYAKSIAPLLEFKRWLDRILGRTWTRPQPFPMTSLHLPSAFPLFKLRSDGDYKTVADLTIQCVNQTIPHLASLASISRSPVAPRPIDSFALTEAERDACEQIGKLFERYGSDKSTRHQYHKFYGAVLRRQEVKNLLEVGLGTNNTDIVSSMGVQGCPGASLRAFREYTGARIYGADFDRRILFREEGIETFFVDQTSPETFVDLGRQLPEQLDLIIDDGLHAPNANLATLRFALSRVSKGGWIVIEDVAVETQPMWEVVSALLPREFESYLLRESARYFMFAVQRID